jgi:Family of unknown function (DUF6220)
MRRGLSTAYSAAAWIVVALGLVQFLLAGMGIFGASSFSAHESVGGILHGITVLVFLLAIAGPRNGRDIGMGFALAAITTIQISLPETRDDAPGLAAFHPLLALAVLGLAAHIGSRYLPLGRGRGSTAAAA